MNRRFLYFSVLMLLIISSVASFRCTDGNAKNDQAKTKVESAKNDSTATNDSTSKKADEKKTDKKAEELVPVEVATVTKGAITSYILLSSNLETEKMADVYSRVQGLVDNLLVEEGEYVRKGQTLVELEADEFNLAEERARVNYEQQQNAFQRAEAMHQKQLLSKEEFEQAKFTAEAQRIAWQEAKLNLDYTKIDAPISGVIAERLCRVGDRIQPTAKLFSIINNDEMIVVVHIPEKEIENVRKGQNAFILSNNLGDQKFNGWVKRVSPAVDPQSGTFKVTVGVKNINQKLRPGMFVNVHIITDVHPDAVLVPKTAIVYEHEDMNVFVVRDSLAHKITLDTGFQNHSNVESLSEIKPGEKIIVVGQAGLKDKTKVKIVKERQKS
ncbi:efflux RND transporter periplasmic adaptor subunit [candidate division KSB1 bacterium]|nr:efflux RND transporter periplasmic adaptor subunit [candidate division KSB1 bacterium]